MSLCDVQEFSSDGGQGRCLELALDEQDAVQLAQATLHPRSQVAVAEGVTSVTLKAAACLGIGEL